MDLSGEITSRYQAFFENLTSENVEDFRDLAAADVRYRDPFTDAKGIDAAIAYMREWFQNMDELQFILEDSAVNGQIAFQEWTMKFRFRRNPKQSWELEGVSKITFDSMGKVIDHIDYWDSSPLLESVPFLGKAVTLIKKLYA